MNYVAQGVVESPIFRRAVRWVTITMVIFLGMWVLTWLASPYYTIAINETNSLPQKVFLIKRGVLPKKGELVTFHVPMTGVKYYPPGYQFTKIVKGVAGDRVEYRGREVYLNGQKIGIAKEHSQMGERLDLGFSGVIPPGHYFAWTPSKDSYDSRYKDIGLVSQEQVVGSAVPLF